MNHTSRRPVQRQTMDVCGRYPAHHIVNPVQRIRRDPQLLDRVEKSEALASRSVRLIANLLDPRIVTDETPNSAVTWVLAPGDDRIHPVCELEQATADRTSDGPAENPLGIQLSSSHNVVHESMLELGPGAIQETRTSLWKPVLRPQA